MLKKFFSNRLNIIKIVIVMIFFALSFKLADLQIVKGDYYKTRSENIRTRNIGITAPRGNIVDRFGMVLATNRQSYFVNILKTETPDEFFNDVALAVINILEENGDTYKDEIPILLNPTRFVFEDQEKHWKEKYGISEYATAQESFRKLKSDYAIPDEVIDIEAYSQLKDELEIELPFKLDSFIFTYKTEEIKWKESNGFKKEDSAQKVFYELIDKYKIDLMKYSQEEARKIMAVKYLVSQKKYPAYEPVEIASNITEETRARIEESKIFLPGVQIMEKPIRKYPNEDFMPHILGYLGKIGPEQEELFKEGYTPQDMIGKSGIEYSMEEYLKGIDGSKQIEVDARGTLIDTIEVKEAVPGHIVGLTINGKLQRITEDVLLGNIEEARKKKPYPQTFSGAAVAIDPNTGAILAMASEPKFNPNLFATGITNEDWDALQPATDDRYAPRPLINNAISYPLPPGSTMKMTTAIAGLSEGKITPKELIRCKGIYTSVPGVAPSDSGRAVHGPINLVTAIKKSCNYFFFETGRRLGGELFEKHAIKLGFGQYTGIELPYESKGMIEGPMYKTNLYESYIDSFLNYTVKVTDDDIKEEIKSMIYEKPSSGQSSYQFYQEMRKRIRELGITKDSDVDGIIWYITESRYRPGDVLNAAIGQGLNNVTVLQLANYVSTIANGGIRYKPYLVNRVIAYDGEIKLQKEPEIVETLDISKEDLEFIKKGMFAVNNEAGGTARSSFVGTKIGISGKTGTAEAGKYRPDPENKPKYYANYNDHSWFVAFAPYEKPEIVVAAVVFQGGFGSGAAPITREIIESYLLAEEVSDIIDPYNKILP